MQPKRICAQLDDIGVTVEKMVPRNNSSLLSLTLVIFIALGVILFFLLMP